MSFMNFITKTQFYISRPILCNLRERKLPSREQLLTET